jgi:predicted dehydrogenase
MNRRTFLAATAVSGARVFGANGRIRAGVIGCGGRGSYLLDQFKEVGAEVGAVCDIYEPRVQRALQSANTGAKAYDNYRRLLEDKSLDVVVVATPDHWHAQMVIDAVNAGKDVYCEKPMAHTVADGFRMIEAVRRTKRVVQIGMQRRSYDLFMEARKVVESGALGDVRLVNSWWLNHTRSLTPGKIEGKLDWDQFLGSAPKRELDPVRYLNWYWFFDYSGGMLIGQAAHIIDGINMLMGSKYPSAVTCSGGKPNVEGAEVPETATMIVEHPDNYLAVFTIGYKAMRYANFNDQLKQFHGSKARFDVGREWYALYPENPKVLDLVPTAQRRSPGTFEPASRAHIRNFLECVVSRKDPTAPVEVGNYTNVALCMALDSLKSGRRVTFDAKKHNA